jgi:linoleoyl-CoA desaturase
MKTNTIKFPADRKTEFIKELRAEVNKYFSENKITRYGNASLYSKTVVMLLLYFIPLVLMLTGVITWLPLIFAAWFTMGIAVAGIGMGVMHDANHGSYSENQKLNRWMSKTLFLLGGFPVNWQYQHNTMHHGFTNIEGHDEDISPVGILRFSPHKPLLKIHRYQQWYAWFLYGLMTFSWVTFKDFKQLKGYKNESAKLNSSKTYNQLFVELIFSKIVYYSIFLVVPLIFIPVAWYFTVAGFLLMHFVAGAVLGIVFQAAHVVPSSEYPLPDEDGNLENNWAVHQLLTTCNFDPANSLLTWYTGGLNHQVEHHLFPNISHVHYRRIAPLVKKAAARHNLPYHEEKSFSAALQSHWKMLWLLGRQKQLFHADEKRLIVA